MGLSQATGRTFLSNAKTKINTALNVNTGGSLKTFGQTTYPQYSDTSGTNQAAGLQAAINQFCPASGCGGGTAQIVLVTDGQPTCQNASGSAATATGTSTIAGQNCTPYQGTSKASTYGERMLLQEAQDMATAAGNLGITVSTIYYSANNGGAAAVDPASLTGQTYADELKTMTTNANAALKAKYGANYLAGRFFNENSTTPAALQQDIQQICSGGANGDKPRLVL